MNLASLLTRIRALNVAALKQASEDHAPCTVEPAARMDDGSLAVDGPNGLPCRCDVFPDTDAADDGEPVMVEPPTRLQFDPIAAQFGGVQLLLQPFGWDYAHVGAAFGRRPDLKPLIAWFFAWFDPDDENEEDPDGLSGVLHYLSDPKYSKGKLTFTVDLGSAPVAAFEALLATLAAMGAAEVTVG